MNALPIITIIEKSANVLSNKTCCKVCNCSFIANQDILQWEVRALYGKESPNRGEGILIQKGNFLKANDLAIFQIVDTDLTNGDGIYTISIYAQNLKGNWSENANIDIRIFQKYNTGIRYNGWLKYNSKIGK